MIKKVSSYLYNVRYIHFLLTGGSGVALNLFTAWLWIDVLSNKEVFTLWVSDQHNTLKVKSNTIGIILGQTTNIIYNFIFHSIVTFKTKEKHKRRFLLFVLYSIFLSYIIVTPLILILNNFLISQIKPTILNEYIGGFEYLIASAIVIFFISIFNFVFFKKKLFKDLENANENK